MPNSQNFAQKKPSNKLRAILIVFIAIVLIVIFVLLALLFAPKADIPEFKITNEDRVEWGADGPVAVFDKNIKPGSKGSYKFIVTNTCESMLSYSFDLKEDFRSETTTEKPAPFIKYRLRLNGQLMGLGEWRYGDDMVYRDIDILPQSSDIFTLEWEWPLDGGNDKNDTLVGYTGGSLVVEFYAWAYIVEA